MATKDIIFLRHGESEFNAYWGKHKADPFIRDAKLTAKGKQQAAAAAQPLQDALRALGVSESSVFIVTSPLSRATETALLACPQGAGSMHLWPEVREMISACDDLGLPGSELRKSPFVIRACGDLIDGELAAMPEVWWTVPHKLKGIAAGSSMVEAYREHRHLFVEAEAATTPGRLIDICRRVAAVQEQCVLIVAHGDLIRELTALLGLHESESRGDGPRGGSQGWGLRNAEIRVARGVSLSAIGNARL
jgi:broad specificity phosphatase PhoE